VAQGHFKVKKKGGVKLLSKYIINLRESAIDTRILIHLHIHDIYSTISSKRVPLMRGEHLWTLRFQIRSVWVMILTHGPYLVIENEWEMKGHYQRRTVDISQSLRVQGKLAPPPKTHSMANRWVSTWNNNNNPKKWKKALLAIPETPPRGMKKFLLRGHWRQSNQYR